MEETRQQSLIEMSRQLEEMRAHQAQQTEAEEQRYRAQELRSQAMQENISRMVEMMQTLMPRPVTYPSSSNHGNTTTSTLPHPSPRPPEPVVVTGAGNSAAEQHVARRAPLNPPGSNRSTDGVSKIAENLNQGEVTLGTDSSVLVAHQVLDKMPELFADKIDLEIAHVSSIEELHDLEAFGNDVSEQVVWALGNIVGDSPQCRDLARQSDLAAHQVLEEMPRPFVSDELIFLDEIEKINEELVDGLNWKAPPMSPVKELDGVQVIEDGKLRNAIPTIHALKLPTELFEQARMMNGVVNAICFDPGGNDLTHGDLAISLPNGNYESKADEEEESIQIARNEKAAVKEIPHLIAHRVFDKIPASQDCHPHKLSDESKVFGDDYQNQAELKTLPTPGAVWLGNGAEKKVKNSIMSSLTNPQKSELHSSYSISGGALVFLCELLDFDIAKDSNLSSAEELTVMTNALVGLASKEIFLSAYGLLFENVVCLDAFCFEPGGDKNGGVFSELRKSYFAVGQDTQISYAAAPDDLKVFREGLTMIYMGLMCFDPGGLLVINAFSCLIANEKSHFGHPVGTLMLFPGSYVAEVLVFLQAFDYEMSAYLGWSAKRKSCLLDVLKETSNMLSCSLGNTKPAEEHKNLKAFEVNDLKYVTPLLLVINEFSDFIKFPSELPAQNVRMVDYIGVLCFDLGGGSLLLVDNSIRIKLAEMTNVFGISLFSIVANEPDPFAIEFDQGKGDTRLLNLVLGIDLFGSVACIKVFCFDPGGEEMLSAFDDFDRSCTGIKLSNGAAELLAYDYDFVRVEVIGLNYKMLSSGRKKLIASSGHEIDVTSCIIEQMFFVGGATAVVHGHQEGRILIFIFLSRWHSQAQHTKWLETESYGVLHGASVALPLCLHCSVYDPWGQGSSQGGSIVTGFSVFVVKPGLFRFEHHYMY